MVAKPIGAATVIVDDDGWILLVKHTYSRLNWELPGGVAEANESAGETAMREVREETGLRVRVERFAGVYYERAAVMHHFVFVCRRLDGSQAAKPDRVEISARGYFRPDDLPWPISDFTMRRVRDALVGTGTISFVSVPPRQWFE